MKLFDKFLPQREDVSNEEERKDFLRFRDTDLFGCRKTGWY